MRLFLLPDFGEVAFASQLEFIAQGLLLSSTKMRYVYTSRRRVTKVVGMIEVLLIEKQSKNRAKKSVNVEVKGMRSANRGHWQM